MPRSFTARLLDFGISKEKWSSKLSCFRGYVLGSHPPRMQSPPPESHVIVRSGIPTPKPLNQTFICHELAGSKLGGGVDPTYVKNLRKFNPVTFPSDPGSPKLRMVLEPKYLAFRFGDEGHLAHHPLTLGEPGSPGLSSNPKNTRVFVTSNLPL